MYLKSNEILAVYEIKYASTNFLTQFLNQEAALKELSYLNSPHLGNKTVAFLKPILL